MTGIKRAIEMAGGACALAYKLGVTHQAIYTWAKRGWVPMQRALEIETEYRIPRTELLKPDLVAVFTAHAAN
jgi:DNA-binding transcriptional regulator YdaS (Cro superfamily)